MLNRLPAAVLTEFIITDHGTLINLNLVCVLFKRPDKYQEIVPLGMAICSSWYFRRFETGVT